MLFRSRSIGEFIKHVTLHDTKLVERNPFPEPRHPDPDDDRFLQKKSGRNVKKSKWSRSDVPVVEEEEHVKMDGSLQSDSQAFFQSRETVVHELKEGTAERTDVTMGPSPHEPAATLTEDAKPAESVGEII